MRIFKPTWFITRSLNLINVMKMSHDHFNNKEMCANFQVYTICNNFWILFTKVPQTSRYKSKQTDGQTDVQVKTDRQTTRHLDTITKTIGSLPPVKNSKTKNIVFISAFYIGSLFCPFCPRLHVSTMISQIHHKIH